MTYYTVNRVICMFLNIMYLEIYLKPSKNGAKTVRNGLDQTGSNWVK